MYLPTTALRKIAALRKTKRAVQGGQGAGKTISIEMLLINHAQHNRDREITILQAELTKLKKTAMRDFLKIMKRNELFERHRWNKSDCIYTFSNGSYIEFLGLDKADIGKGFRRDIIYFNELNKGGITLDTFIQFASRAKVTYFDFNPDRKFWAHDEIIGDDDCDFISLTYLDNEYIPYNEKKQILQYKEKGFFDPDGNIHDESNIRSKYWANKWKVYGLGLIGQLDGLILTEWEVIDHVPSNAKYVNSGLDFGFTNDPTTLIDHYTYNSKPIFDENLYRTGMVNNDISKEIKKESRYVYADSAEPKSIEEIRRTGCRIYPSEKGRDSVVYGLDLLQQQKFYVTSRSKNLINELESYTWDIDRDGNTVNKPIDTNNHCIDAIRYAFTMSKKNRGKYDIR